MRRYRVINGHKCGGGKSEIVCAQLCMAMSMSLEDPEHLPFPLPLLLLCQTNKTVEWARHLHDVGGIPKEKIWRSDTHSTTERTGTKISKTRDLLLHCLPSVLVPIVLEYAFKSVVLPSLEEPIVKQSPIPADASVVILTHSNLTPRLPGLKARDQDQKFETLIIDESHVFKNPNSKMCISLMEWIRVSRPSYVILNTANPIEKYPVDIFVQLHVLAPDRFTNWYAFAEHYCYSQQRTIRVAGGSGVRTVTQYRGAKNPTELKRIIDSFMIQTPPDEIDRQVGASRLPVHKEDVYLECTKEKDQTRLKAICAEYQAKLDNPNDPYALKWYQEMDMKNVPYKIKATIPYLKRTLKKEMHKDPEQRFICFGYHKKMMAALEQMCLDQGWSYVRIDGHVRKKQPLFDRFQAGKAQVAILSVDACGTGVNVHRANHVFFCELPFNASRLMQGGGRADRIGQEREVFIWYLLLKGSTDIKRSSLLQRKLDASAGLLDSVKQFRDQQPPKKKRKICH